MATKLASVNSNGPFVKKRVLLALNSKFCQRDHGDATSFTAVCSNNGNDANIHH